MPCAESPAADEEEQGSGSEGKQGPGGSGSETGSGSEEAPGSGSEEEGEESSSEEEIDQTIYAPPRTAALPADAVLVEGDEARGVAQLAVPSAAVGELLAAYNAMRAFSWQLRLSPFSFPDLCAAVVSTQVGGAGGGCRWMAEGVLLPQNASAPGNHCRQQKHPASSAPLSACPPPPSSSQTPPSPPLPCAAYSADG